jgi:hypothetical protein
MTDVVAPWASEVKTARIIASSKLTEDDLIEAVGKVDAEAVEALIMERGDAFQINAAALIRLADSGVPESVIDLAVAVSYPDRFAVKRGGAEPVQAVGDYGRGPRRSFGFGVYNPYYWGFGGYGYHPMYGYGYGYSPWGYGYGYGGYGYGYGYYRPTRVIVQPYSSAPSNRMVKGYGYSRGGSGGGYSGGRAVSRGGGGGGSMGSSGSGGSRTASPGVRSSGGSSGGRTAVSRGGRGGRGGGSF